MPPPPLYHQLLLPLPLILCFSTTNICISIYLNALLSLCVCGLQAGRGRGSWVGSPLLFFVLFRFLVFVFIPFFWAKVLLQLVLHSHLLLVPSQMDRRFHFHGDPSGMCPPVCVAHVERPENERKHMQR